MKKVVYLRNMWKMKINGMSDNMMRSLMLMIGLFLGTVCVGQTLDEAKQLYNDGDYADAADVLSSAADKEPKNTTLNHMAGVALQHTGNFQAAKKYLNRGTNESNINLAEIAFMEYQFDEGDDYLDKYEKTLKKGKKNAELSAEAVRVRERISKGREMLERVEKIVVIDSITVGKDDFFKYYKLMKSAGNISGLEGVPSGMNSVDPTVVYTTEDGRHKIWSVADENENYVLAESWLLDDGKWSAAEILDIAGGKTGDLNYPFLMNDGISLYFSSDNENSLGGYDIFLTRRDGDEFYQPQNVGMPYNSPYNDYLLAIDEENGSGWWATDRNSDGEEVTIYRFIPNEYRENYPLSTENLESKALMKNYRSTQDDGTDYESLIKRLDSMTEEKIEKVKEFEFGLPDGRIYTSLSDFHNRTSRNLMEEYLSLERRLKNAEQRLSELRKDYSKGRRSNEMSISTAESDIEAMRSQMKSLKNDIIRNEK